MLDLKCRLPCVPLRLLQGFSLLRAVYALLLKHYARESGKTYGHSRLVFSLLTAGYESFWLQSSFRPSATGLEKTYNYNTRLPYKEFPLIMGCMY